MASSQKSRTKESPDPTTGTNGQVDESLPVDPPNKTLVIDTIPIEEPALKTRINPADILIPDDELEELTETDDEGSKAKWSRPKRDTFYRAHPTWTAHIYVLDCRKSGGLDDEYILSRRAAKPVLASEVPPSLVEVYLLANRDNKFLFWPVSRGDALEAANRDMPDHVQTAREAVAKARVDWVRIFWKGSKGDNGWFTRKAQVDLPDSSWPEDVQALFFETVHKRYIDDPDDQRILRYLGRAV
jgi:hypothetical protein